MQNTETPQGHSDVHHAIQTSNAITSHVSPSSFQPPASSSDRHAEAWRDFRNEVQQADLALLSRYYGPRHTTPSRRKIDRDIADFILQMDATELEGTNTVLSNIVPLQDPFETRKSEDILRKFMQREELVRIAYGIHKDSFPSEIWYCCKTLCFASISSDPLQVPLFDEILQIHRYAEGCHKAAEVLGFYVQERRKGVGTSTVAFASLSREQREARSMEVFGTQRQKQMLHFARFVEEVLPFLYGKVNSPRGTVAPKRKICTVAICCLLGVSRNFLYYRKKIPCSDTASEEYLRSLVDITGLRLRQHRREGKRGNYPPLQNLQTYDCGCDVPCFADTSPWILVSEFQEFSKLARSLNPRHKENCYLLNRLFDPFCNSTSRTCNRALSALYAVSESLIADVRQALDQMCSDERSDDDEGLFNRAILHDGSLRYKYHRGHPINRYGPRIREKIENTLDFVLRADPSGGRGKDGQAVYRVYDPEINTQEKLRETLKKALDKDSDVDVDLSASSLQRMVNDYLISKNHSRISFQQSDHNACPLCKTLRYAILQYHHEVKIFKRNLLEAEQKMSTAVGPLTESDHLLLQQRIDDVQDLINTKQFQEERAQEDMRSHNERDGRIRNFLKELGDYFREKENSLRREGGVHGESRGWNTLSNHACISHQDDMTKVDLPHFVVNASSDITRWRFDVNAHVNSVTNDTIVFSHEQGTGAKNGSMILEEILLHHILTCRGEDIKIIVSDNASVGKNWLNTIALPQYFVDQGFAKIVMVIFLENNHGKWLADMLFGQFQTRRRRSLILGIDDLLEEFQRVRRKSGFLRGYSINPLSCIDFAEVLRSLGYQTSPPAGFNFPKRNIHFSCACAAGAKEGLPTKLKSIIGNALPDNLGMVRISTEPPKNHLRIDSESESSTGGGHRYFDVPAVQLSSKKRNRGVTEDVSDVPIVVPLQQPYKEKGNLVVSHRTAKAVDHNGFGFRNSPACPELKDTSKPQVRRAWPPGLLDALGCSEWSNEQQLVSGATRCAPENWIVRRPVSFFCKSGSDWKARYPPRNLLNAKCRRGPRETDKWIPTATYKETPFPVLPGTCAKRAAESIASLHTDINESMHVLQILQAIFGDMDEERDVSESWGQRNVTVPCTVAIEKYKDEMKKYAAREEGSPAPAKSMRQFFKEDPLIVEKVASEVRRRGLTATKAKRLESKLFAELFVEAEDTPCGLDRYQIMMEKDVERYSREMKAFEVIQKRRDEEERRKAQVERQPNEIQC